MALSSLSHDRKLTKQPVKPRITGWHNEGTVEKWIRIDGMIADLEKIITYIVPNKAVEHCTPILQTSFEGPFQFAVYLNLNEDLFGFKSLAEEWLSENF